MFVWYGSVMARDESTVILEKIAGLYEDSYVHEGSESRYDG